ncbi:hypothetical protein FACS18949_15120 [Clostridia bacterium]|nr:hypothetical protein FACS18949_15120 [Clostridia bacterium]
MKLETSAGIGLDTPLGSVSVGRTLPPPRWSNIWFYIIAFLIALIVALLFTWGARNVAVYISNYVNARNESMRFQKIELEIERAWNDSFLSLNDNTLPVVGEQRSFVSKGNPDTTEFELDIVNYNKSVDNFVYDVNTAAKYKELEIRKAAIIKRGNEPFDDNGALADLHSQFLKTIKDTQTAAISEAAAAETAYAEKVAAIIKKYGLLDIINLPDEETDSSEALENFYKTSIWYPQRSETNTEITENVFKIDYKPQINEEDHTVEDKRLANEMNSKVSQAFEDIFAPFREAPKTQAYFETAIKDETDKYRASYYEFDSTVQRMAKTHNDFVQSYASRGELFPSTSEMQEINDSRRDIKVYAERVLVYVPSDDWTAAVKNQIDTANAESVALMSEIAVAINSFAEKTRQIFADYGYNIDSLPGVVDIYWAKVYNTAPSEAYSKNEVVVKFIKFMFEEKERPEPVTTIVKDSFADGNYFVMRGNS